MTFMGPGLKPSPCEPPAVDEKLTDRIMLEWGAIQRMNMETQKRDRERMVKIYMEMKSNSGRSITWSSKGRGIKCK